MFWNIGFRETQPCIFFSSSDRQSVIVVWDESRVCVASCDREIERNSELSASLLVKRRYVLNKHIFFAVCTRRVRTSEVESKRGDKEKGESG